MAGDWIKMRVGLTNHPRVLRIAECLIEDGEYLQWAGLAFGIGGYPAPTDGELRAERHAALRVTRYVTVTALLRFWGYANEHTKGEQIAGLWPEDVDEIAGLPGFAKAMEATGWAKFDHEKGGLTMPNFEEHNTSATVRSTSAAERQKRYRERQKETATRDVTSDVTVTPREEKSREEKIDVVSADAEKPSRRKAKTKLPADFEPNETGQRKCLDAGFAIGDELTKFRNHHEAQGSVMADWQAGFRTWIDKAEQFRRPSRADVAHSTVPSREKPFQAPPPMSPDELARNGAIAKQAAAALGMKGAH